VSIIKLIASLISVALLWFKTKLEKDAEVKKKKQELLNEVTDAIDKGDTSAITSVFDRARRLR
jgi:diphthamide synthase (EF-2-diphthine--ammonia ligase)